MEDYYSHSTVTSTVDKSVLYMASDEISDPDILYPKDDHVRKFQ